MQKYGQQQGAVLITGMIILVVMVILGVSAVTFTALSEKMAGNQKDKEIALQAAESALTEAENWLRQQITTPLAVNTCQTAPCDVWVENFGQWQSKPHSWWIGVARMFNGILEG
ncbi:MAG TPA: PilX N-terminal domain-containing pilus assembly protein, partial [Gammaproteobacteria bacterium]|nr:PilX N-terminal domain-containing pilus assembly protein [Gammaproteobacteria bacterium]